MKKFAKHKDGCKIILANIRIKWGNGFKNLGEDLQSAILSQQILYFVTGRQNDTVPADWVFEYNRALHYFAGLNTFGDLDEEKPEEETE